jgi:hypothetical protein
MEFLHAVKNTLFPPIPRHPSIDRPSLIILYATAFIVGFSLSATHSVKYYFVVFLGGSLAEVVYTFIVFSFVGCVTPFMASMAVTSKMGPAKTYRPLFIACSIICILSDVLWGIASNTAYLFASRGLAAMSVITFSLAQLHLIDMSSLPVDPNTNTGGLPSKIKMQLNIVFYAYAILGITAGALCAFVVAFIPVSVLLFKNPLRFVLPAWIDAILRIPYTIFIIWKLRPLENIKYGDEVPPLREQFRDLENPTAFWMAGLAMIVAFLARSFTEVYAPIYGAGLPFNWVLWSNALFFTLLSVAAMILIKPSSLKLICHPFYLLTKNCGCWKRRDVDGDDVALVNGSVFMVIIALIGCLILIDYAPHPSSLSSSSSQLQSSSMISLGQFIVGISLVYLFGGALIFEASGGLAQNIPSTSPHGFFLGAATCFQMIGRIIGPVSRFHCSAVQCSAVQYHIIFSFSLLLYSLFNSHDFDASLGLGRYCLCWFLNRGVVEQQCLYNWKLSNIWLDWHPDHYCGDPYFYGASSFDI